MSLEWSYTNNKEEQELGNCEVRIYSLPFIIMGEKTIEAWIEKGNHDHELKIGIVTSIEKEQKTNHLSISYSPHFLLDQSHTFEHNHLAVTWHPQKIPSPLEEDRMNSCLLFHFKQHVLG